MPRPLDLRRFSGAQRIGHRLGIEAGAFVTDADGDAAGALVVERRELDVHALAARRCALPCLMALMTDSRTATPTQWTRVVVESGHPSDVVADDLHEVEHVEGAVEVETDSVAAGHQGLPD